MADLPTDEPADRPPTSLADDERKLDEFAAALAAAIDAELDGWIGRCVTARKPAGAEPGVVERVTTQAIAEARAEVMPKVRTLLAADIAEQRTGPLDILRSAVRFVTPALEALGAPRVQRGDFEQRAFPQDHFELSPASFADISPELHEPGLMWGAAKAHVHLRRRREGEAEPAGAPTETTPAPVVAFAPDLMDASKVKGALDGVTMVRSVGALAAVTDARVVLVDLGRPGALDAIAGLAEASGIERVIAFGSHVDEAVLADATARGADEVLARSVFFSRLAKGTLLD